MSAQPGLAGVVPFRWSCHRCARCCSGGSGQVWLAEGESAALAAALGMEREAFERLHVRLAPHPEGGLRPSLREEQAEGGRCSLLAGANECSAYQARPAQCRSFPFWERVLGEHEAFERARQTCPGIAVEPAPTLRARAFAELEALYAEVERFVAAARPVCLQRGLCCRFEQAGHELFATALEADYALARHPEPPAPEAPGRCPWHVAGRCTAREGRPLGCRTYFCETRSAAALEPAHERFLARVREIERALGYPAAYARFPALVATRVEARDSAERAAPRGSELPETRAAGAAGSARGESAA